MAIVTFGNTIRAHDSVGLKNTGSTNLVLGTLRSTVIGPGTTKYLTLADLDARLRGRNLNHNDLYSVNSDGKKKYQDDVAELAALIVAGTIAVHSATQNTDGTFTDNGSAAYTALGDGSVTFS